jgi:hypothetical protein
MTGRVDLETDKQLAYWVLKAVRHAIMMKCRWLLPNLWELLWLLHRGLDRGEDAMTRVTECHDSEHKWKRGQQSRISGSTSCKVASK